MHSSKERVVIFGGSFDPIHVGHIALAREIIAAGLACEVWFMVSPQNPHKRDNKLTDENVRLRMVQIAIEKEPCFIACDFEFSLPRPSYTLHTLNALEKQFVLLVGADNWEKFDLWYKGDEIVKRFGLIVYPRGGEDAPQLPQGVTWLSAQLHDVSSTQVRSLVAAGGDAAALLPCGVYEYIIENGLYK